MISHTGGGTTKVPTWIYVVLFWLVLSVVYASQMLLWTPRPSAAVLRTQITWQAVAFWVWAPMTLVIWHVTRNWDSHNLRWWSLLGRHLLFGLVVAAAQPTIVVSVATALLPPILETPMTAHLWRYMLGGLHMQLLIYAAIVGVGQAMAFHGRYRERQIAAARLEAQLAAARLEGLRAQLQPHFLFNSLHIIAARARAGDNGGVVRLLSGLGDLLRHSFETSATHHSLADELALVERYLDIQRVRFGDRLRVSIDATPEAAAARVPLFIVQPLIENALRHGLASRVAHGQVRIDARREADSLRIDVIDDGVGLPAGWTLETSPGTGLRNLASRLEAEFGTRQALTVTAVPKGGVRVAVSLPFAAI
jgi:signal transduction histidine kinase